MPPPAQIPTASGGQAATPPDDPEAPFRAQRGITAALTKPRRIAVGTLLIGVVLVVAILAIYLTLGARTAATPTPTGFETPSVSGTSAPSTSPESPKDPSSAPPLPSATDTGSTDNPGATTQPTPPVVEPSAEPTPSQPTNPATTAPALGVIKLNDTSFTSPEGWVLYGDELIETDRRLVRLNNVATNIRIQVVTLKSAQADLIAACRALVTSQAGQFNGIVEQPASPVGVNPAAGKAATCGFKGVRISDGLANAVTFTLLRRATDSHVLMLRSTVPDAVASASPAPGQLAAMQCAASAAFGVALPLC